MDTDFFEFIDLLELLNGMFLKPYSIQQSIRLTISKR